MEGLQVGPEYCVSWTRALPLRSVQTGAVRTVAQIPLGSFHGTSTVRDSASCVCSPVPYGESCVDGSDS